MKKVLSLALSLCLMCSAAGAEILTIDTETASESELTTMIDTLDKVRQEKIVERLSANAIHPTDEDIYTFNSAPWYCTKSQAEQIWNQKSPYANFDIRSTYIFELSYGIQVLYKNTNVAGYSATINTKFIFPIEDGIIIRNNDLAQLYEAAYWISDDYKDLPGIYEDLESKLTSIYGTPHDASDKRYFRKEWSDKSGNQISLSASTSTYNIAISYVASDAEERVATIKEAITNEEIRKEQLDRLNNSDNVDGL